MKLLRQIQEVTEIKLVIGGKGMELMLDDDHHKPFDFREFSNLDNSDDMGYLIESMDKMYSLDKIKFIKERAIELLALEPGHQVLELGCGLGHDAEVIAKLVGKHGSVVAIDSSKKMLQEARRRSRNPQVHYMYGNANKIQYPDASFNASYADRLLVSQKDVNAVLHELTRVVKPGGKVCVTDIDVGSAIMYPNINRKGDVLLSRLSDVIQNPFIGRELHVFLKELGLIDLRVLSEAYVVRSLELVNTMIDFKRMIIDLYRMKTITRSEAQQLYDSLHEADNAGNFLYSIILFTVVGTKKP